jgi:hypothetical protein
LRAGGLKAQWQVVLTRLRRRDALDSAARLLTDDLPLGADTLVRQSEAGDQLGSLNDVELLRRLSRELLIRQIGLCKIMSSRGVLLIQEKPGETGVLLKALAHATRAQSAAIGQVAVKFEARYAPSRAAVHPPASRDGRQVFRGSSSQGGNLARTSAAGRNSSGILSCSCLRSATVDADLGIERHAGPSGLRAQHRRKRRIAIYQRQRHDFGEFVERLVAHRFELGRQLPPASLAWCRRIISPPRGAHLKRRSMDRYYAGLSTR